MDKREAIALAAESRVGYGYIYGATGWVCTQARLDAQAKQYPAYADKIYYYGRKLWMGKVCYDCAQLTRRAARDGGHDFVSGANSQWNMGLWAEKGEISTLPENEKAVFLFIRDSSTGRMKHVGVTVGEGFAVEARGYAYGVVRRKITDGSWTHWARLADIDGQTADPPPATLQKGSKGETVVRLQTLLQAAGFSLPKYGADGIFGSETQSAVKDFQTVAGLISDGVAGPDTWAALLSYQAGEPQEGEAEKEAIYCVRVGGLTYALALALAAQYPGAAVAVEGGDTA